MAAKKKKKKAAKAARKPKGLRVASRSRVVRKGTTREREPARKKKATVKKPGKKKLPLKKKPVRKAPVRKPPVKKKPVAKKPVRKPPVKKKPVKKAPVRKPPVKKPPVKKKPVKKAPVRRVSKAEQKRREAAKKERDRLYQASRRARLKAEKAAAALKVVAALEKKKLKAEKARLARERKKICAEFFQEPSTVNEIVWGSNCFLRSDYAQLGDGFEGRIQELAGENLISAIRRLQIWTAPWFRQAGQVWARVGVWGVPPEDSDIDFDEYEKWRPIPGRPELSGAVGRFKKWKLVNPGNVRSFFVTPAQVLNRGLNVARNFKRAKFKHLVIELNVWTGKDRPA